LQKGSNRDFRRRINKAVNRYQEVRQAAFSEISAGLSAVHLRSPFISFLTATLELLEVRVFSFFSSLSHFDKGSFRFRPQILEISDLQASCAKIDTEKLLVCEKLEPLEAEFKKGLTEGCVQLGQILEESVTFPFLFFFFFLSFFFFTHISCR